MNEREFSFLRSPEPVNNKRDIPQILVVDDNDMNRRVLEAMMIPMGYHTILAADGKEAIELIEANPPDVILLDAMMPVMDGFETARRIKENEKFRIIPIVMVTALDGVEDRIKALKAGADDFLTKPVDETELQVRVSSSLKIKKYNDYMRDNQAYLEERIKEQTRVIRNAMSNLQEASLETIMRLTKASEYRDDDTGDHINRVSLYAGAIARELGMGEEYAKSLEYAAPMHDVGKIGIPDGILLKPGRLTEEEWKVMKTHTTMGRDILQGSKFGFIKLAEELAYTHHEKWDGSGYPRGLTGNEIPTSGLITAIVDVFDALLSKRPYKEPFPLEKTLSIIKEGEGRHFSPEVLKAFFGSMASLLEIREKLKG